MKLLGHRQLGQKVLLLAKLWMILNELLSLVNHVLQDGLQLEDERGVTGVHHLHHLIKVEMPNIWESFNSADLLRRHLYMFSRGNWNLLRNCS